MTRIVVDSTCDLPAELMQSLDIVSVPLTVHFGDEVLRDKVDLDEADFFRRLDAAPKLPTTSQPPPGDFEKVYQAVPAGEPIISIHIASQLSGTWQSAKLAADGLKDRDIRVIDSGNVSWAAGLMVMAASDAIREGKGIDEVEKLVLDLRPRARLIAILDTLKYAIMGGRVSRAQGMIGGMLRVKPLINVKMGVVGRMTPARTWNQGYQKLVDDIEEHGGAMRMAVIDAQAPEARHALRQVLVEKFPKVEILEGSIGPVVATYSGPGAAGVAYLANREA